MKRIVKITMQAKSDELSWYNTLVESAVSDAVSGEDSTPGRLRRFYTTNYKSLDQFDQLWYEISYGKRDRDWRTCYLWALILGCIVNARSAYCEELEMKEPIKLFVRELVQEIRSFIATEEQQ